ncbi:unnamed protein product [Ectocarpus sp. 13 AM-2016]
MRSNGRQWQRRVGGGRRGRAATYLTIEGLWDGGGLESSERRLGREGRWRLGGDGSGSQLSQHMRSSSSQPARPTTGRQKDISKDRQECVMAEGPRCRGCHEKEKGTGTVGIFWHGRAGVYPPKQADGNRACFGRTFRSVTSHPGKEYYVTVWCTVWYEWGITL